MNRISLVLIFAVTSFGHSLLAQNFQKEFSDLLTKKDTLGQRQLLSKWEKANSQDPELFVAYFNFYINKSRTSIFELGKNPKGKEALEIKDTDTSNVDPVGFIYENTQYEETDLRKGLYYIDKGIKFNPKRLDMRWGEVYVYGEVEDYEKFTVKIINAVDYSDVIKNEWLWGNNKPIENGKERMLEAIQGYQTQLYNTGNDSLLDNMKRIAEAVLKYYPDHVESLSNISVVYLLSKEYDKALPYLLKAEKVAPKDYVVLGNIAQAYRLKGDYEKSIKYYELMNKYGDEEAKAFSKKQIEELKIK